MSCTVCKTTGPARPPGRRPAAHLASGRAKRPDGQTRLAWPALALALALLLAGCAGLPLSGQPTALPPGFASTAAAQTLVAGGVIAPSASKTAGSAAGATMPAATAAGAVDAPGTGTPAAGGPAAQPPAQTNGPETGPTRTPSRTPAPTRTPAPSATAAPSATPTIDPVQLATALAATMQAGQPPQTATPTQAPPVPNAAVQIYRLGEMSRVLSPIDVNTFIELPTAKAARIELYGEDGRLLARHLRQSRSDGSELARMGVSLEFEIPGVAEIGRLVVSVEDAQGRMLAVNSVNLVLLSAGDNQVNPATALLTRIDIQEPRPSALIVGGRMVVRGRALLNNVDQPLRVMLVASDGRVLGQRLAGIQVVIPGDFALFSAEVPYTVTDITQALLIVYEEGGLISQYAHLSSLAVVLAP
ncbi:MAG: hypothetical protein ACKOC5_08935 [Chloroflexota bacterium]